MRGASPPRPTGSAWRVWVEVTSMTLAGSLLVRWVLSADPIPAWLAPAIWLYVPLLPLRLQQLPLAPHGYGLRLWFQAAGRSVLIGVGILAVFAALVTGWRLLAGEVITARNGAPCFETALVQLMLVAVPEELFFRGYVQERLRPWATQSNLPPHTIAILLSAMLFALAHVMVSPTWRRGMVFFPGCVMGWLRVYSRGLLVPTLFHWLSNLLVLAVHL